MTLWARRSLCLKISTYWTTLLSKDSIMTDTSVTRKTVLVQLFKWSTLLSKNIVICCKERHCCQKKLSVVSVMDTTVTAQLPAFPSKHSCSKDSTFSHQLIINPVESFFQQNSESYPCSLSGLSHTHYHACAVSGLSHTHYHASAISALYPDNIVRPGIVLPGL